jgi:hypothetical protein
MVTINVHLSSKELIEIVIEAEKMGRRVRRYLDGGHGEDRNSAPTD